MEKIIKIIAFFIFIIITSNFVPNNSMESFREKYNSTSKVSCRTCPKISSGGSATSTPAQYSKNTDTIPENIVAYLQKSETYSGYYNQNKKFVIYYTGANCPYLQSFLTSLNAITNDAQYQQYYNFMPVDANRMAVFNSKEDARNDTYFNMKLCHEFCIVNPAKKEIFFFDGIGEEEATMLPSVFNDLKNW